MTPASDAGAPAGAPPRVTVITAVWNGAATLERTVKSVLEQTWRPLEHRVVDGGSTDGTLDLLRRYQDRVRFTSEPDHGLYDAMNKGLAAVEDPESYVMFLNADDTFAAPDALEGAIRAAAGEDLVYGRLERFDEELRYRDVIGREVTARDMLYGMRCHHQAMLVRRRVFDRIGSFDLAYRIAADYDWTVRAFQRADVSRRFVPVTIAVMSRGGLSDRRYLPSLRERWRVVSRRYPPADRLRYAAYTWYGDYLRYWAQQALKRVGLLNLARDLKRGRVGGGRRPQAS